MNATQIEYRDEDGNEVGRVDGLDGTCSKDRLELLAQQTLASRPEYATAHIFHGGMEKVVSKTTEWQRRNG